MNKQELLRHIGSVEQIGGIRSFTFNDGKAKGVQGIEVNTGKLRFTVLPDRGMDIAQAFYKEQPVSWISKTGITAPTYYEKEGKGFLRGFYGGLVTTCGLKNIGSPTEERGLHGRIANIPAQRVSIFADWVGEDYVMKISGEIRESVAFGENLVLKRTIITKLFSDTFTLEDTIVNEGFRDEEIALCYHCNFGYPLVREGAKVVGVPEEMATITPPTCDVKEECIPHEFSGDVATVGIENGEIGAYITYERSTLPDFLLWKMLGEGDYVVGLEPRTTALGGQNIIDNNAFVTARPFEEYKVKLTFYYKTI